jgi:hypothetical protein
VTRLPSVLPFLFCVGTGVACESAFSVSSDGILHVLVTSSGSGSDSDGFILTVDGGVTRDISAGGNIALEGLSPGTHTVLLSGIASNCAVQGENPRSVEVGTDGGAAVSFTVTCQSVPADGFRIFVSTTGDAPDPDGYRLAVAGVPIRSIPIQAEETFVGLTPGGHLISLKDMAEGCVLQGGNPQLVEVRPGRMVEVRFDVLCGNADLTP